jgi:N-acetylglucosaminyl-diphospho-decaprenol L-rhamnosyltransferase
MSVGFVIVTYNSAAVLRDCLASIPSGYPVIAVDNASRDDSVAIAESLGARIVSNPENLGFGAACNRGAKLLSASHVFFLNPDAVLADTALAELERAIQEFPDAGGFGPAVKIRGQVQSFRIKSYIQDQGRRYIADTQAPSGYTEVDFIDGAALICDLKLFSDLGGFDESLFLYYEDDDLSFRIRAAHKKLIFVPQSIVFHKKKSSSGSQIWLHYFRSWHETSSRIKLSKKYRLPFDMRREKKRAFIRLFRSALTMQFKKAARYLGVARALKAAGAYFDTPA